MLKCKYQLYFLIFILYPLAINALEWEFCGLAHENILAILIDPRNNDILYVSSSSNFSDGTYGKIFKSVNGGASWDTLLTGVDALKMVMHPDSSPVIYAALATANFTSPGVIKTMDGGKQWVKFDSGITVDWETGVSAIAIDPHHPHTLYAGTGGIWGGNLYYSYNGGISWTNIVPFDLDCNSAPLPDICRLRNSILKIVINSRNTNILYVGTDRSGDILKSVNGGASWSLTGLSDQGFIWALLMDQQDDEILFASSNKGFYKTTDGGLYWQDLNKGKEYSLKVTAMTQALHEIYITSWKFEKSIGGIFKSSDGGSDWQKIDTTFADNNIGAMAFSANGQTLYLGGGVPGLYKTNIKTSIYDFHTIALESFCLYQNYPNPFNSETCIHYKISFSGPISLKIFNVNGQLVRTLFDDYQCKGEYIMVWDGKDDRNGSIASGLYVIKLEGATHIMSRKVIYLK